MSNRVSVIITADDQATAVLERFASNAQGMIGGAIGIGLGFAKKGFDGFMGAVNKASDTVTDNIMAVGSLASVMGSAYDTADKLNNKITKGLAEQAASLPGTTDDYVTVYRTISDDVADMSKELNKGKFNAGQFEKQVVNLSSKFTALKGSAGIGETTAALQALLGGRDVKKLGKLKFFRERNPMLTKNLGKMEEKEGKSLADMGKGQRLQVILKALDMTLTDDTIARMSKTFDAIKQTFLTKMFDPNVGMFGLLRDVDSNLENGMQTAFGGLTEALDSVIGENGILISFGKLMSALGLNMGDPMVMLRDGAQSFARWMNDIANWMQSLTGIVEAGGDGKQVAIANLIKGAMKIPEFIGRGAAQLVNGISAALLNLGTWQGAAQVGGLLLMAMGRGLTAFITSLSPQSWFIGSLAVVGMILVPAATAFVATFMMAAISAIAGTFTGIPVLMIAAAGLAAVSIGMLIVQNFSTITAAVGNFLSWVGGSVSNLLNQAIAWISQNAIQAGLLIGAIVTGNFGVIGTLFQRFFGGVTTNTGLKLQELAVQAITWITNLVTGIGTAIQSFFSSIPGKLQGMLSSIQIPGMGGSAPASSGTMTNHASGLIPGGMGGLLGAAMREARAMPAGAQLAMANTSEMILNRRQQGRLAGAGGGSFSPNIVVNASPGMDTEGLANMVMQRINEAFHQYEQGFLS